MSVDLSNLKLVEEVIESVDDQHYSDATEFAPPPPEGFYTLLQGKPEFGVTDKGALKAEFEPHTIVGGDHDGEKIKFDRVNNQTFDRKGVKVSFMKDHLRAVYGPNGPSTRTHAEYADALVAAEGKPFKAKIVWEASCGHKDTEHQYPAQGYFRLKGQRNFPSNGTQLKCPTCGKELRPNASVDLRIVAQP